MENVSQEVQNKIGELQMLHQRLSVFGQQKQQLQIQLLEIESALKELKDAKTPVFKLIGDLLIEKNIDELNKDLSQKKEDLSLRVTTLETQESKTKEKATALQKEVAAQMQ